MVLRLSIAMIVPITTSVQLLPQLYKSYKTKSVKDLSIYTLLFVLLNNILWLIHGYFIFDYSLIVSGILNSIITIILLVLYDKYNTNTNTNTKNSIYNI
jgi:MtN3 and saliva related transmembrane protein